MATEKVRIVTPEAVASYPNIAKPRMNRQGKEKYSISCVFPAGTDLRAMKEAALKLLVEKFGKDAPKAVKKGKLAWPFRDDPEDIAEKGYPEGSTFVNMSSDYQPGVVNQIPDANGRPTLIDPESIYPGCIIKVACNPYTYDVEGNKGVTFGLGNIQFIRDGKRLDSFRSAQDDFEADPNAVATLESLENDAKTNHADDGYDEDPLAGLL